jgi:hypothetical protein
MPALNGFSLFAAQIESGSKLVYPKMSLIERTTRVFITYCKRRLPTAIVGSRSRFLKSVRHFGN